MPITSIPLSLIVLGGNIILKNIDGELGKLQPICDILKKVDASLVIEDFKSISTRKEISLNGHLHQVYVKAITNSVNKIKKAFKNKEGIKLTLLEHLSTFPTTNRKIYGTLEFTCEQIINAFLKPGNIEIAFDENVQILDDHKYFEKLIDLMVVNGKEVAKNGKNKNLEPYLYFSDITQETLVKFIEILKLNLPRFFSEEFKKALHENGRALNAYGIYMQHAIFQNQSKQEQKILDKIEFINRPPLKGLSPNSVRGQMDHFSFRAQNSQFVGREDARLHLKSFMNDEEKFRWLIVSGEGGSGKSRLAYELCVESFLAGWDVGFFDYDSDENYSFNKFSANKNTLIVFDYIGTDENFKTVCNAIKKLNQEVNDLKFRLEFSQCSPEEVSEKLLPKIRFVLLERFLMEHQVRELSKEDLRLNFYPFLDPEDQEGSKFIDGSEDIEIQLPETYKLRELSDEEKWELIEQIAEKKADKSEKQTILNQIASIDPLKRPLFIFMAATALKENDSIRDWDKQKMLSWHLMRLESKMWRHHPWYKPKRKSLKNLIWITTIANTLYLREIEGILVNKTDNGIPCFDFSLDESFYDNVSSLFLRVGDHASEEKYEGLQPDIVAEYYIISHLSGKDGGPYSEKLQEVAWKYFPNRTLAMLSKAARDFIDDADFQRIINFLFTQDLPGLGKFFYVIGNQLVNESQYERAIEYCHKAIDLLESHPEEEGFTKYLSWTYYLRGISYKYLDEFDKSTKDFHKSTELEPEFFNAYYHLFEIYQVEGEADEALSQMIKGVNFDSNTPSSYINKGVDRFSNGQIEKGWFSFNLAWIIKNIKRQDIVKSILPFMPYIKGNIVIAAIQNKLQKESQDGLSKKIYSFYPNYTFYTYTGLKKKGIIMEVPFIADSTGGIAMVLNGSSATIHALNKQIPLEITDGNVVEYLTFFCDYVHGDLGPFKVINTIDDFTWVKDFGNISFDDEILDIIKANLGFVDYTIGKEKDAWQITRLVNYGNHLFESTFKVHKDGSVDMGKDKSIAYYIPTNNALTVGSFFASNINGQRPKQPFEDVKIGHGLNSFLYYWIRYNRKWLTQQKLKGAGSSYLQNHVDFVKDEITENKSKSTVDHIFDSIEKDDFINKTPLSFYPDYYLCEIEVKGTTNNQFLIRVVIDSNKNMKTFLNGSANWIHALNFQTPIVLDTSNISEYLLFFSHNVHGEEFGAFYMVNSVDDIVWKNKTKKSTIKKYSKILEQNLQQVNVEIIEIEDGKWGVEKLLLYGSTLFLAQFEITKKGEVRLVEDKIIEEEFPVKFLRCIGCFYGFTN